MNLLLLLIFSIVFLVLDVCWIQIFKHKFNPMIENIQNSPVVINMYGVIGAYLIMLIAYYNLAYNDDKPDYFKGILLGLAIYGTYEFTNYATINKWHKSVMAIDIGWGICVSVLSLYITNLIYVYYKKNGVI